MSSFSSSDAPNVKSWQVLDKDPLNLAGRRERQASINRCLGSLDLDRISHLARLVRGKKVLDVGCVQNDASCRKNPHWLHRHLVAAAATVVGIDILEEDLKILRDDGFQAYFHDLTQKPYPKEEKFDVVVAGEILEHIDRPGPFFAHAFESLVPGGWLVLTTPYPWFVGTSLRNSLAGCSLGGSLEHVAWFDPFNIVELCGRHGFFLRRWHGLRPDPVSGGPGRWIFEGLVKMIRKGWAFPLSPLAGCRSLLYECQKKS